MVGNDGSEMSFWDHIGDLRKVLLRIVGVVVILGTGAFAIMPTLFDNVIMAPCSPDFPTYTLFDNIATATGFDELATNSDYSVDIVSLELSSQLFAHLSAAAWTATLVGFPIIIYLLWGFVSPALHANEKRGIVRAFIFSNILFYLGVLVSYFLVFPLALRFLSQYSLSEQIRPLISLDSYMSNFFMLLLAIGAVFELPLLSWLLGKMGILSRNFFSRYRRHAIVILLIVAAVITPTGDPFTLFIVFLPIYALWEGSALLVPKTPPEETADVKTAD